jgi:hypothetical protein
MADEGRTDWWTARRRATAGTTPSPRGRDASGWRRRSDPTPATTWNSTKVGGARWRRFVMGRIMIPNLEMADKGDRARGT